MSLSQMLMFWTASKKVDSAADGAANFLACSGNRKKFWRHRSRSACTLTTSGARSTVAAVLGANLRSMPAHLISTEDGVVRSNSYRSLCNLPRFLSCTACFHSTAAALSLHTTSVLGKPARLAHAMAGPLATTIPLLEQALRRAKVHRHTPSSFSCNKSMQQRHETSTAARSQVPTVTNSRLAMFTTTCTSAQHEHRGSHKRNCRHAAHITSLCRPCKCITRRTPWFAQQQQQQVCQGIENTLSLIYTTCQATAAPAQEQRFCTGCFLLAFNCRSACTARSTRSVART